MRHRPPFQPPAPDSALDPRAVARARQAYQKQVEPIFENACFDCHTSHTTFPWYHHLPGVQQWLNSHVEEGRHHLDMTEGFPFKGHAPLLAQLRGISRSVQSGAMPMWTYRLMHKEARLSAGQKKLIEDWVTESYLDLSRTAKPYAPATPKGPRGR